MLILISDAFDDALPKMLEKYGEVTDDKSRLAEATVCLIRSATKCTPEWIDSATNLKLIIRGGVGMDNIDREYAASKGVKSVNTAAASAIAVAEIAMALMLTVPCNIIPGHVGMRQGQWLKKKLKRTELYKKTLGIIGLGNIGTEVAKRAKAFGMEVIAYRLSDAASEYGEVLTSLDDLYARADFISLHVPQTPDTVNMINTDSIAKMKDGVIIVNTGRGKCVAEDDMVAALKSKKVRGYATDVWYSDPPAPECPILEAPNTVMTPHIGASTKECMGRIGEVACSIIEDFVKA
jgi:D-3-phosphoglycerate dehydrogenase